MTQFFTAIMIIYCLFLNVNQILSTFLTFLPYLANTRQCGLQKSFIIEKSPYYDFFKKIAVFWQF
jgi:hypothetical protein